MKDLYWICAEYGEEKYLRLRNNWPAGSYMYDKTEYEAEKTKIKVSNEFIKGRLYLPPFNQQNT